jgi:hypothetical protein
VPATGQPKERALAKDKLGKVAVMATKKAKGASRRQVKKKSPAPQKKKAKTKVAKKGASAAPRARAQAQVPRSAKFLADSLVSCPTRQYIGTIELDDANGRSFLQTDNSTFLIMLDRGCTGVFDPRGVAAAYAIYRVNPGRGGQITCQGFLHQDGRATVLHVVG